MDTVQDFEDALELLEHVEVRYLIIGGLAFIYYSGACRARKPVPTGRGSARGDPSARSRAERHRPAAGYRPVAFDDAWPRRVEGRYGRGKVHWIDLDSLIAIKSEIDDPRRQEDARVLKLVRERRDRGEWRPVIPRSRAGVLLRSRESSAANSGAGTSVPAPERGGA